MCLVSLGLEPTGVCEVHTMSDEVALRIHTEAVLVGTAELDVVLETEGDEATLTLDDWHLDSAVVMLLAVVGNDDEVKAKAVGDILAVDDDGSRVLLTYLGELGKVGWEVDLLDLN